MDEEVRKGSEVIRSAIGGVQAQWMSRRDIALSDRILESNKYGEVWYWACSFSQLFLLFSNRDPFHRQLVTMAL